MSRPWSNRYQQVNERVIDNPQQTGSTRNQSWNARGMSEKYKQRERIKAIVYDRSMKLCAREEIYNLWVDLLELSQHAFRIHSSNHSTQHSGAYTPTVARTLTSPTSTLCGLRSMTKRAQRHAFTIPLLSSRKQKNDEGQGSYRLVGSWQRK